MRLMVWLLVVTFGLTTTAMATEPTIDPRMIGPAFETLHATIKLRDVQIMILMERVKQLETDLQIKKKQDNLDDQTGSKENVK